MSNWWIFSSLSYTSSPMPFVQQNYSFQFIVTYLSLNFKTQIFSCDEGTKILKNILLLLWKKSIANIWGQSVCLVIVDDYYHNVRPRHSRWELDDEDEYLKEIGLSSRF